jgi:hypothetical protein
MDRLRCHEPEPSRDGLDDPDPFVVSSSLVGHALTGDDRLELESMCRRFAEHADQGVRDTAGLCLGHIGRRFGVIENDSWEVIQALASSARTDGRPSDAIDDLRQFAGR